MNEPLVSIIVPCYKQAIFLPETLNSVIAQTYRNWQCIIVNDGSPDNTSEVAKTYCKKDTRFLLLEQENQGLAMARNNGIKYSHGEYILPLDSDDLIEPAYIEKAIKYYIENPNTKLVYSEADRFYEKNESWNLPEYKYENEIWVNSIFCSAIYKRSDYDKTIGYNPNMKGGLEDWDFWLSLLNKNDHVYRIPEVLFHYRFKENSMLTEIDDIKQKRLYRQIYLNHPEIYEDYVKDFFNYKRIESDYKRICKSKTFLLARFISSLISPIKKICYGFRSTIQSGNKSNHG